MKATELKWTHRKRVTFNAWSNFLGSLLLFVADRWQIEFPPPQLISAQAGIRRGRTAPRRKPGRLLFFLSVFPPSPPPISHRLDAGQRRGRRWYPHGEAGAADRRCERALSRRGTSRGARHAKRVHGN